MQLLGSTTWCIYGTLAGDVFILAPNLVGATLAIVQITALVYIHLRKSRGAATKTKLEEETETSANRQMQDMTSQANHAEEFHAELANLKTSAVTNVDLSAIKTVDNTSNDPTASDSNEIFNDSTSINVNEN